ncbi:class I SAM-dependent methyltransferase [Shewanella sp. WXL01]|uniref:class I SAM-dependent methyltransferase n=1 Tax=Shewanella sp. WXL01 TaxID=2709721 RepID=UPI00143839BC|nr:class I SAM-dependent methyltransferase [Shewanella sp. WXL01]NKF52302.1 class I SAM-dependent methyltransferase [Shewanella sp. WXL01]
MSQCPLCLSADLQAFHQDKKRHYLQCQQCKLVTVPAEYHLCEADEKAFYDLHDNDVADEGYQRFLSRTLTPLLDKVLANASDANVSDIIGLDFGCGEGAVLSQMAAKQGVKVMNYDLYYHNDPSLLALQYDFISMTEVIEHVYEAKALITQLSAMLKAGGTLAIMTKRVLGQAEFVNWHYKNDPTHINFYSEATFAWLARELGWQLEVIGKDVVFFTKP